MALPGYIRKGHRIFGTLWLLTLALSFVVDTSQIPGPSIPGLLFIALIISGSYLLIRPWVRGAGSLSDRIQSLKRWTWTPSVVIRRTHRIASTLFLLFLAIGLAVTFGLGVQAPAIYLPVVIVLLYLAITGLYMYFQPWVARVRTG